MIIHHKMIVTLLAALSGLCSCASEPAKEADAVDEGGVVEIRIPRTVEGRIPAKITLKLPAGTDGASSSGSNYIVMQIPEGFPEGSFVPVSTDPCILPAGSEIVVTAEYLDSKMMLAAECPLASETVLSHGSRLTLEPDYHSVRRFTNPVYSANWADPTIWFSDGVFRTYSTMGSGVKNMLSSTNLVSWKIAECPFSSDVNDALVAFGNDRWAPDVVRLGSKWMMYITCRNDSSSGIAALSADSAEGPFSLVGRITYSGDTGIKDSIDPEVVRDPADGTVWMFFGSTGKMHRVRLSADGTQLASGAKYEHIAGVDVNTNSARNKVFEGAYLYFRDGWWYLFASAAQYWNASYKVVVGRSRSLDGVFLDKDGHKMTEGYATPVISSASGDRFYGPGHNGEIFTDSIGQDFILYHCHDTKRGDDGRRYLMIQRLFWDADGWPYVDGGKPCEGDFAPAFL